VAATVSAAAPFFKSSRRCITSPWGMIFCGVSSKLACHGYDDKRPAAYNIFPTLAELSFRHLECQMCAESNRSSPQILGRHGRYQRGDPNPFSKTT
jgi:hypothetical protein